MLDDAVPVGALVPLRLDVCRELPILGPWGGVGGRVGAMGWDVGGGVGGGGVVVVLVVV